MLGYKPDAQGAKKKKGGRIVGPGTGTSDSIKKDVPDGTYIMPADSTEQIGEQALAGMGSNVPVSVSNGEYEMPPEQVHAIGAQALDQMRNATHEPVPERGHGYGPEEAELFFANGGLVEDEDKKKNSFSQFDPSNRPAAAPSPLANQPARQNVLDTATQATAQRAQDPIIQNAPKPEEPATLGSVVNAGPGTANVGPFKVSHLPQYGKPSNAGRGFDPNIANEQQNYIGQREMPQRAAQDQPEGSWSERALPNTLQRADQSRQQVTDSWGRGDKAHAVGQQIRGGFNVLAGTAQDAYQGVVKPAVTAVSDAAGYAVDTSADFARGLLGKEGGAEWRTNQQAKALEASQQAEAAKASGVQPAAVPVAGETVSTTTEPVSDPIAASAPIEPAADQPLGQAISPTNPQRQTSFDQRDLERYKPENINTISSQAMTAPSEATQQALRSATLDAASRGDWAAVNRQNAINAGYNPAQAAQAQMRGGRGGAGYTVIADPTRGDRERKQLWSAATTAHRGAQNGQLTAAQMNTMRGLMSDERTDATSRRNVDANNAASMAREGISQAGQDRREESRNAISTRQQDHAERIAAPQIARAEQLQGLYDAHAAAETPEERSAIQEQMKFLQSAGGQSDNLRNNFMTVGGGQEYDSQASVMRNVPQRLFDLRTVQEVGGQPERRKSVSMDEVKATAKARGVSESQVLSMLKQQGVSVNG